MLSLLCPGPRQAQKNAKGQAPGRLRAFLGCPWSACLAHGSRVLMNRINQHLHMLRRGELADAMA